MKILHVVPFFPPAWAWGGPVITSYEICRELVKRGHKVTVYTTDSLNPDDRVELQKNSPANFDGIEVYYFRNLSNWLAGRHHLQFCPSIIGVARHKMKEFDIVHLHGYRTPQNIVGYYYAKRYGIPYVLHAQGTLPSMPPKRPLKVIYDSLWGHSSLKHASRVIAMCATEAEQYKGMGVSEEKIAIIPTGIDLTKFENLPPKGSFRQKQQISDDEKLILYLGRIHQSKGLDLLVKAFARLSGELDRLKLAITGPDDGYLTTLKTLIKDLRIDGDSIIFTGPLYGQDKIEAYVDADAFVIPSAFEPYGLVLLEACACGTPVICSKSAGLAKALNGVGGLATPYDESELLESLVRFLGDDEMRRQLGQGGRRLVHEQFNLPRMIDRVEQLYQACLE